MLQKIGKYLGFLIMAGLVTFATKSLARTEPWNHFNNPMFMLQPGYEATLSHLKNSASVMKSEKGEKPEPPFASITWSLYRGGFAWRPRTQPMKPRLEDIEYKPYTREEIKSLPKNELATLSPAELLSIVNCDFNYEAVKKARTDDKTIKSMKAARSIIEANQKKPKENQINLSYDKLGYDWLWHGYCDAVTGASIMFKEPTGTITKKNCDGVEIPLSPEIQKAFLLMAYDRAAQRQDADQIRSVNLGLSMDADYRDLQGKYCENCGGRTATPEGFTSSSPVTPSQWEALWKTLNMAKTKPELPQNRKYLTPDREADLNAGSFHLALANQIGVNKKMIAMDRYPGDVVWNFPITGYTSTQITEKNRKPTTQSAPGTVKEVFMSTEITYSVNGDGSYPAKLTTKKRQYEYYLELDKDGKILGGSWSGESKKQHPDNLWHPGMTDPGASKDKMFSDEYSFLKESVQYR